MYDMPHDVLTCCGLFCYGFVVSLYGFMYFVHIRQPWSIKNVATVLMP